MKKIYLKSKRVFVQGALLALLPFGFAEAQAQAQTLAFPGAEGFGRFAQGARGVASPEVYVVTNLNDSGAGSFRDAVSRPGRFVVFAVGGIIRLNAQVVVSPNVTIAGQTAPGDGIVLYGRRVTFSGASNTIARFLRIRLGANAGAGQSEDASGIANGANMIFDHMSFSWGLDEVFSINWDGKGAEPDNITIQNSIIGQGLHRHNHSAGGLIQSGGKISILKSLYISNKTRNPKVKGVHEFVNNVIYNFGNAGNPMGHSASADAYIMGDSQGDSFVNILNNYFVSGPLTTSKTTPFSRGTATFQLHAAGNYFDTNKNGVLDGELVPFNATGYPGITVFRQQPFEYPAAQPDFTAAQAFDHVLSNAGASYPRRDQVDLLMIDEVESRGTRGMYVYRENDLPLANGGLGEVFGAPAPLDSDGDGMPDAWEEANGLDKNSKADAVANNALYPQYLNIEVYVNSLVNTAPAVFIKPPSAITLNATSVEEPTPASTIVINWQDNADNEEHFILERSANGTTYTQVAQVNANTTTYTDAAGLLPNVLYYYRLKAVSATESSAYSTPVSVRTPPVPTAPVSATTPTPAHAFRYAELASGTATLRWTGSSNTERYDVFFGTDPASLTKRGEVAYSTAPSYQVTGLADNTTYYWRVDASNNKGAAAGEVWSFRTQPVFQTGLVGHWNFDEPAGQGDQLADRSAYEAHGIIGLDDDGASMKVPGRLGNALNFSAVPANTYAVSVPHQDHLWLDKNSFTLSFWMKAPLSVMPPDNNSSAYILAKGSFTRNATTGATGKRFNIEFKNKQLRFAIDDDNDAGGGGKDELQTDATTFFNNEWVHVTAIRDAANRKLLVYRNGVLVREQAITKALSGIGEASALVLGNIGELELLAGTTPAPYRGQLDELLIYNYVLSAQEIQALAAATPLSAAKERLAATTGLVAYPNPMQDKATVAFTVAQTGDYSLEVYDLKGALVQVVARGKAEASKAIQHEIVTSRYTSGMYLLKLVTNGEVITKRLVVQRK